MSNITQTAALLLERVPAIVKNFKNNYRETGMVYNIFKVAGINEREPIMCRVLADLLDPKGLHYRGSVYLKLFMDMVVVPHIKNAERLNTEKTKVRTEYSIDKNRRISIDKKRRIDIVLDDGTVFIPIEVKINAGEQEKQLTDYAAFSRKMNESSSFIPVLFLTPDGHKSEETAEADYVPISFNKQIIPWLVKCLNLKETDKATPVREILKQYIKAIKSFCEYMEDEEMANAINALITESRDSYEAALSIKKAVDELVDFNEKAYEIFKDQIFSLVKRSLPDAEYKEYNEEVKDEYNWYYFSIPVGHDCKLCVNYNMNKITVESDNPKRVDAGTADKIRKIMSGKIGVRDGNWDLNEGFIWASEDVKYPGLEDIDDDDVYKFELYRLYSKEPQAVADRIVSWAHDLKNI